MRTGRTNQAERGSSLLESALVLMTFLMLLIGTIDFGQVMYFHQALVERARAAGRYGAIHPTDTAGIKNVAIYNVADTSDSPQPILASLTSAMVDVQNPGINTPSARVVVTISGYPIQFLSPYIAQAFNNQPIRIAMTSETQVP